MPNKKLKFPDPKDVSMTGNQSLQRHATRMIVLPLLKVESGSMVQAARVCPARG